MQGVLGVSEGEGMISELYKLSGKTIREISDELNVRPDVVLNLLNLFERMGGKYRII